MLSQAQRTAILELSAQGVSKREIARLLQLSRPTVRKVLRSNSTHVPEIQRAEKAEPYRQQILELLISCKGNLVRVHEELTVGGAVERVMIDNTHVVVLRGTGREMIPVPEMEAFAERFGFRFVAHQIGDANRSARVERPFSFIENNFLAGRAFASWDDLNRQARQWCDRVNSTYKKHIRAVPRELFAIERTHLKPLPAWIPEVYRLHQRTVDVEGYISVHSIRYSVPVSWIGRRVEVRETRDKIEIELDARDYFLLLDVDSDPHD
jgi:predicted transcriptional regulator